MTRESESFGTGFTFRERIKELRLRIVSKAKDIDGQMTIGLCVALPVIIIVAVISVNAMVFFGNCAAFDRECRNAVRLHASSMANGQTESQAASVIASSIRDSLKLDDVECEMREASSFGNYVSYKFTYKYSPTLFGLGLKEEVFGVSLPKPSHSISLTLDPYSPGQLLGL